MAKQFLVANWKSNKTITEAIEWFKAFHEHINAVSIDLTQTTIILCAPYTLLSICRHEIDEYALPIKIAAQNISAYGEGAYTGEINGKQIQEFASYVMIGHAERRRYFGETDMVLAEKVNQAHTYHLEVIYCVEGVENPVPDGVSIISYEPKASIGSGYAATPVETNTICQQIKTKYPGVTVLYGGSVSVENITALACENAIDGILSGTASLSVDHFFSLLTRMSSVST